MRILVSPTPHIRLHPQSTFHMQPWLPTSKVCATSDIPTINCERTTARGSRRWTGVRGAGRGGSVRGAGRGGSVRGAGRGGRRRRHRRGVYREGGVEGLLRGRADHAVLLKVVRLLEGDDRFVGLRADRAEGPSTARRLPSMILRSVCSWATHPPVGYPVCSVGHSSRLTSGNDSVWAASAACLPLGSRRSWR